MEFRNRSCHLLDRRNSFAAELLLREALTNAIVHGCQKNPSKQVHCRLRLKGRRLLIVVKDEGDGFDWRGARGDRKGVPDSSGRGIEILRKYADRVRYNEKGNAVTIVKWLC